MRAAWRLAISSLSGRRRRTALLAAAVALSAALIVGVSCAMESIHGAINHQLAATVGAADLRIRPAGATPLPESVLERVRAWPEIAGAEGRLQSPVSVSVTRPVLEELKVGGTGFVRRSRTFTSTALALNLPEKSGPSLVPAPAIYAGRAAAAPDEVVLDELLAYRLSYEYATADEHRDGFLLPGGSEESRAPLGAGQRRETPERVSDAGEAMRLNMAQGAAIGDGVEFSRPALSGIGLSIPGLNPTVKLKVVGIASLPPLGGRPQAYLTMDGLRRVMGTAGRPTLTQIDLSVKPGLKPDQVASAHRAELGATVLLETTEKITAGLDRNVQGNQLGMVLATVMAFLSASFIIMTGLSIGVTERLRELAIIRCIGGERGQLARAQMLIGAIVGICGAAMGVPLGIALAWALARAFRDQLPTGLALSWWGMALGAAGALAAGIAGAAWPAWQASRVSPLDGLGARSIEAKRRGVIITTIVGLAMLAAQAVIVATPRDGQAVFWGYATAGLPLMFVGYFLLGVPAVIIVSRVASGAIAALMRIPKRVLARTVQATPYRHGFTAGALMAGLALMVAIWTNGGAILRDWLGRIEFPDAFVSGVALPESAQRKLASMDIVGDTCAITLHAVETDVFGVRALQKYKTTFVGFEPEPFFRMAKLTWIQGDERTAVERLKQGGAVIVAREFLIAQGLGVGHKFHCGQDGVEHEFEIVGVVSSPGLEIVSKFFSVGEDLTDQSVHAVFGSRDDMKAKFFGGEPAPVHLIQIQFAPSVPPSAHKAALDRIRREMAGYGVLDVGSGIEIKEQIRAFAKGILLVFSSVAIASMLVACFGVANLIAAGVEARTFEFGVLRSIGAQQGVIARLVAGEALVVSLAATILGTCMGIQGSWAGQRLYALLLGLDLHLRPPPVPIVVGWAAVIILSLLAAIPAIWRLNGKKPRDLLATVRG
jgi:putative ABC transport system permease protein